MQPGNEKPEVPASEQFSISSTQDPVQTAKLTTQEVLAAPTKRSGGPKSVVGKERSKGNSLKHGIFAQPVLLKGESQAEFNSFRRDLFRSSRPVGAAEKLEVDMIVAAAWRCRRSLVAESALIQRSLSFPQMPNSINNNIVYIGFKYGGEDDESDGLMQSMGTPKVSNRDYCLGLLRELEGGITEGFHKNRDSNILTKLYGENATKQQKENLFKKYQTWFSMAHSTDEERQEHGFATPEKCKERFLKEVRLEIDRLEQQSSSEAERSELERLVQNVPDDPQLDRLLRYQGILERQYSNAQNRLERLQRARRGQPPPPKLEIQHSIS